MTADRRFDSILITLRAERKLRKDNKEAKKTRMQASANKRTPSYVKPDLAHAIKRQVAELRVAYSLDCE
jgi:hypothetical protein